MFRYVVAFLVIVLCATSRADGIWGEWQASGNGCDASNVEVLEFDGSVGVLFGALQLVMDATQGKPVNDQKNCEFKMMVTPPPGRYLAGFRQLYSGGVVKGRKSSARLDVRYKLLNIDKRVALQWSAGREILPEDPDSLFAQVYDDVPTKKVKCREKSQYTIQAKLSISRSDKKEVVMLGLDSVDAELVPGVRFIPLWKPCDRK